jgi:Uma2 family endonuclease
MIDNGLRLGWLINPQNQQVEIYRLGKPVEIVQLPVLLSGEEVLQSKKLPTPQTEQVIFSALNN